MNGTVEVDGAYFGGYIRPANEAKDRIDRRLAKNQTGKRRVVIVARERKGRTMTTVTKTEADGVSFVSKVVSPGSVLHADEASHWDALHAKFKAFRINHQEAYSLNGACTNQAESFLARLRKMVDGQHHHVSPQHLHQYAAHAAWMEDLAAKTTAPMRAAWSRWPWRTRSAGTGRGIGNDNSQKLVHIAIGSQGLVSRKGTLCGA